MTPASRGDNRWWPSGIASTTGFLLVVLSISACPPGGPGGPGDGGPGDGGNNQSSADASTADRGLTATIGRYNDGTADTGIAVLLTLRDNLGAGPHEWWTGALKDANGTTITPFLYTDSMKHDLIVLPMASAPPGTKFTIFMSSTSYPDSLSVDLFVPNEPPLAVPALSRSADVSQILWPSVSGAAAYTCYARYYDGSTALSRYSEQSGFDVSTLPDDVYTAKVYAYSTSLAAVDADVSMLPSLPNSFHASSASIAFARGTSGATIRAVGGHFDYGGTSLSPAVHVAIAPLTADWWYLQVVGPGFLRAMDIDYPPATRQFLAWSYDEAFLPGVYTVAAISDSGLALNTSFTVDATGALGIPTGVTLSPKPNGRLDVSWSAVPGAASYFLSSNDGTGTWTTSTNGSFAPGTFWTGFPYKIYVAAADVDMTASVAPQPAQVLVSENYSTAPTYTP